MKKLLYCAAALAMALFAGSCQKENLEPEGGNIVTYTVQVPDALSTKAIGTNVSAVTELVYEVYRIDHDNNDEEIRLYQKKQTRDAADANWTVELELVNNQDFRVLFWAQVPENGVYTTQSLKAVELSTDLYANAENYAAFAGQTEIKYNEGFADGNITLVRPVAQLNIATSAESLVLGEGGSVTTTVTFDKTSVEVKGLSNVYNVAAEEAVADNDGSAYIYKATNLTSLSEDKITVNSKNYTYVSMNYVGFIPKAGDNVDVKYTIKTTNVGTITNEIKNVPVKANYRTNIIGNLITSTSDYTVELSNQWPTEDYKNIEVVSVSTAADLQQAINEIPAGVEGNIKLEGHIDLSTLAGLVSTKSTVPTYGLLIPSGKTLVLDLNGNTLSQTVTQTGAYSMIQNDGVLTIIDAKGTGKISYSDTGNGGNYVSNTITNRGTLIVKGGTIENITPEAAANIGYAYTIDTSIWGQASEVVVNIEGGIIKSIYSPLRLRADSVTEEIVANISGGEIHGRIDHQMSSSTAGVKATLNITGGTFNQHGIKEHSIMVFGAGEDSDASGIVLNITGGDFLAPILIYRGEGVTLGQNFNEKFITGGTFTFDPSDNVVDGYEVIKNGNTWTIGDFVPVAKIGDKEYGSIQSALNSVNNNETIILLNDCKITNAAYGQNALNFNRAVNCTIDLNGKTLSADTGNSVLRFNIADSEATSDITLTLKNGKVVAGSNTWCAVMAAGKNGAKAILDIQDVIIENCKPYDLAVKAWSYGLVKAKDVTVNATNSAGGFYAVGGEIILDNCTVDQKGLYSNPNTSVALAVSDNGKMTVNSGNYKSEPTSAEEGNNQGTTHGSWVANVMNSGGTLIIKGGSFANGNYGDDNLATAARGAIQADTGADVQICGGVFNALKDIIDYNNNLGDAAKNPIVQITGGTFSANPGYLAEGYEVKEENGMWVVNKTPVAQINGTSYDTLPEAVANANAGETITLINDVTLSEDLALPAGIIFNGNGKQINGTIYAEGNLTFAGHTKVTAFSASYYNRTITIGEGACLEVTGTGRVTLGYGNTFNITGNIENAKTADKTNIQPSLIIPGGISITGGNDAAMNVTNAYVQIGSTTSKNNAANGKFILNFDNSIAEFTAEFGFYEPKDSMNPTFEMNIKNSVFTTGTKLCVAAINSKLTIDNSRVTLGNYLRNSGQLNLMNGSILTGSTIQFGENGGNNGIITVDNSEFTITTGNNAGHAFDGKGCGKIVANNYAKVSVEYYKAMTIEYDTISTFTGTEVQ